MTEAHENEIIRVATARHPVEAHIWRQALEAEGVHCEVVGDYLLSGETGAQSQSELWVHRRNADLARAILQVYQQAAAGIEDDDDEEEEGEEEV
jgi:hypothetical protein